jgi:hypothetical protein
LSFKYLVAGVSRILETDRKHMIAAFKESYEKFMHMMEKSKNGSSRWRNG